MQSFVIGRGGPSVDIAVPPDFKAVSRMHLRVTVLGDNRYRLDDLNSTAGTFMKRKGQWEPVSSVVATGETIIRLADFESSVENLITGRQPALARPGMAKAGNVAAALMGNAASADNACDGFDVFIAHSSKDIALAEKFAAGLERQGVNYWWDRKMVGGDDWRDEIENHIKSSKAVIVLWTPNSKKSKWVRAEAEFGFDQGRLVSVLSEGFSESMMPMGFSEVQAIEIGDCEALTIALKKKGVTFSKG